MSALKSQLDESAIAVMRNLAYEGALKLPEEVAHRLGLDVYILAGIHHRDVHPQLDYMAGYRQIMELVPAAKHRKALDADIDWASVVIRSSFPARRLDQVLTVFNERLDGPDPTLFLAVFLTREDQWITWLMRDYGGTEDMRIFDTVYDLCYYIQTVAPDEYRIDPFSRKRGAATHMPLRIAQNLMTAVELTIDNRKARLRSFEHAHKDGTGSLGLIEF